MKRSLSLILIIILAAMTVLPLSASAKSGVVYILTCNTNGARVRSTPSAEDEGHEVLGSLKKGTKVLYLGKKGSMYRVTSEYGKKGYVYSKFFDYYGAATRTSIYRATAKLKVYSKANTSSRGVTKLVKGQIIIVSATKGGWAKIQTIGGKSGYVKKSKLKRVF